MDGSCLALFAVNSFAGIRDLGHASGVCHEWRSFIRILPAAQQFLRKVAFPYCQVDAWPFVDGIVHPREMFADNTGSLLRSVQRYQSASLQREFFAAWNVVIRNLPSDTINEIYEDGTSLLSCMLIFSLGCDFEDPGDHLERLVSNFMSRTDLNRAVLKSTLTLGRFGFPGTGSIGTTAPMVWLCMRGKKHRRNGRSTNSGNRVILEKLPDAVLESCFVPSLILPGSRDNILQYILEPVSRCHATDKAPSEARLCQVVAQQLGLKEHLHRNSEGIVALSYAEQLVHNTGPSCLGGAWVSVRDIITKEMLEGCRDLGMRADDESFLFLTYVVQELEGALESALSYEYEDLDQQSHLRHIVEMGGLAQAKRADGIRMQWLARGWRFAHCGVAHQIAEVLRHYESVRIQQDADRERRLGREACPSVRDLHTTSSELLNDDQTTSQGAEALNEEAQEAESVQTADAVIEHVVHNEPAAMPHANDAAYRGARQQLIVDEEWAQGQQRQINNPSSNSVHPAEEALETDGIHLRILEFSRTPKAFHVALSKDNDLSACTVALREEGYNLDGGGGAKIYVSPWEYRKAAPYALGLQSRHVVVSERYVEIVLAAVRSLKGKDKVHEKCENRCEIEVSSRVEVTGLVNKRELNGHSGIVLRYVHSQARWAVRMIDGEREVLVLPKNLRLDNNELLVKNTFIHIPTPSVTSVSIGAQTY